MQEAFAILPGRPGYRPEGLQENLLEEPLGEEHPRVGTRRFLIQPLFLCGKYKMSHQKEQTVTQFKYELNTIHPGHCLTSAVPLWLIVVILYNRLRIPLLELVAHHEVLSRRMFCYPPGTQ